jgi:hypothetical protein
MLMKTERYLNQSKQQAEFFKETLFKDCQNIETAIASLEKKKKDFQSYQELKIQELVEGDKLSLEEKTFEYHDELSQQITKLHGDIQAIDDCFFVLEPALGSGKIDLKTFAKESRDLSRQQFLHKALLKKIHAQCLQFDAINNPQYYQMQLQQLQQQQQRLQPNTSQSNENQQPGKRKVIIRHG